MTDQPNDDVLDTPGDPDEDQNEPDVPNDPVPQEDR